MVTGAVIGGRYIVVMKAVVAFFLCFFLLVFFVLFAGRDDFYERLLHNDILLQTPLCSVINFDVGQVEGIHSVDVLQMGGQSDS